MVTDIHFVSRDAWALTLLVFSAGLAGSCRWTLRCGRKRWLLTVLTAYTALLLALFAYGLFRDSGYGWAFLPLLIATLPWSFFALLLVNNLGGGWFASSVFANFMLIVALCGGMNQLLVFALATRAFRAGTERIPSIRPE